MNEEKKINNRIPLFKALKRVVGVDWKKLHEKVSDNSPMSFVTFVFITFCQLSNMLLLLLSLLVTVYRILALLI